MIGLRIAQGLLCAVEVCGLYFLIQLFFERRWDSSFSKILWMISGAVLCGLIIYQKDQVSMYSRYFMLVCIVISAFLTKFCVDISLAKAVLISALYFESICFFDIFLFSPAFHQKSPEEQRQASLPGDSLGYRKKLVPHILLRHIEDMRL